MITAEINGVKTRIFDTPKEALDAGCFIDSPIPDGDGLLHAHLHNGSEWTIALVRLARNGKSQP